MLIYLGGEYFHLIGLSLNFESDIAVRAGRQSGQFQVRVSGRMDGQKFATSYPPPKTGASNRGEFHALVRCESVRGHGYFRTMKPRPVSSEGGGVAHMQQAGSPTFSWPHLRIPLAVFWNLDPVKRYGKTLGSIK